MTIRLWAPLARVVSIVVDGARHPMTGAEDGWWTADQEFDGEHDYGFVLDDDPTLRPDPRSMRQPYGVNGASRSIDLSDYHWTDHDWTGRQLPGSVLYELHIGTFTPDGTLLSAIDRLDHLVDLGVDAVELLPVNSFNGARDWGYDGVLWFAVDETYGGPRAYQSFVDACHRRGLAVVQDVVYNHLGPSGNHLPNYGPYLHDASTTTWGASINLDEPAVRRYIIDNALMWLHDFHVDGLRLDAVHALVDRSQTHILRELADEVHVLATSERRPLFLIAESDLNDPILITPREAGGHGLDAQWSDDFHHALHVALTGETFGYYADFEHLDSLAKVFTRGFFHDGTFSSFRGRLHGKPIDTAVTAGWRLVVTNQNHDQVGNRAAGDRPSATLDFGQLAIAGLLTLTSPFTPMLFMGEEWGSTSPFQFFTAHPEPELGRATAEGRIAEFEQMGWDPDVVPDPQDPDTFRRSKLDWDEATRGDHARLLSLYRELIALRRTVPELVDPRLDSLQVEFDDAARWMIVRRPTIAVAANFGPNPTALALAGEVVLATTDDVRSTHDELVLPGHSAAIIRTSDEA